MQAEYVWNEFLRLPSEAQQPVADYIAFLGQRNAEKKPTILEAKSAPKRFAWGDGGIVVGDPNKSLTDELRRQRDEGGQ